MSGTMTNPPVYFTLAYIGFDEVKALSSKYIPDVQEAFRKKGFTKYEEQKGNRITIESSENESRPEISLVQEIVWIFGMSDSRSSIVLTESGLTLQTTEYPGREAFFKLLLDVFSTFRAIVGVSNVTEVSIRYFDAVIPGEGEDISNYMASEKPSELELDGSTLTHRATNSSSVFISRVNIPESEPLEGTLVVGTNWFNSKLSLPADITLIGLKFDDRFATDEAIKHVVVDFQHKVDVDFSYDEHMINLVLCELHGLMKSAFSKVFSSFALEKWK